MKKLISLAAGIILITGLSNRVFSQTDVSKAQAKFIYNFTRFIEWPSASGSGNFNIAIYGSSQLYNDVKEYLSDKMVGTRTISIQKVSGIEDIGNCQLLFVGFSKTKDIKIIKTKLNGNGTLIVSEREGALEEGSTINFVLDGDKLSYEIRPANASKVGLTINSTILKYARNKS